MLEHLIDYCKQYDLRPEPGFKAKYVKWAILCKPGGGYLGVSRLGDAEKGNKNPGRMFDKAPDLTQPQLIGLKNCRHFLADSLAVVTLLGSKKPNKTEKAKHGFFTDLLRQASSEVSALAGLAEMLGDEPTLEKINRDLEEQGAKPADTATFMVGDEFPLAGDEWHAWWGRWWRENAPLKLGDEPMLDFLTAEASRPLLSHFKIMGLAGVGGQPSGDALVSFDKEAFQSYRLDSSRNAAFSPESAILYSEAFNHLIRNHSRTLAGVKATHWYKTPLPDSAHDPINIIMEGGDPEQIEAALRRLEREKRKAERRRDQAQDLAGDLLGVVHGGAADGKLPNLAGNHYYSMVLSGAAGRVMLRDWMEGSFEDLTLSMSTWFDQLDIVGKDGGKRKELSKLYTWLAATVRDLGDLTDPQVTQLYSCALNRRLPFPRWVLAKTLLRTRADVISGESPRYNRMGLLKAWLQRNSNAKGGEQLSSHLNKEHPEAAYQCGRLMAVYAALQKSALGDVGAGVVQRYYAAASMTPALILGRLAKLSQFHLSKLDGGLAYWYEGLLGSIWEQIDHSLPASLDLEEQGLFALGYYQQLADMRRPKNKKTDSDTDAQAGEKE